MPGARRSSCCLALAEALLAAGTDGLLIDKTRPSRIPPLDQAVIERVVALTLARRSTAPSPACR